MCCQLWLWPPCMLRAIMPAVFRPAPPLHLRVWSCRYTETLYSLVEIICKCFQEDLTAHKEYAHSSSHSLGRGGMCVSHKPEDRNGAMEMLRTREWFFPGTQNLWLLSTDTLNQQNDTSVSLPMFHQFRPMVKAQLPYCCFRRTGDQAA